MASAKIVIKSVIMPAGDYLVGDPCYAVPDDRWQEFLEAARYREEPRYLVAEIDGMAVLGVSTAYGDGEYTDTLGNAYPVDAGLIGVVPVEVAGDVWEEGVHRNTWHEPFECWTTDEGLICLGSVRIDTGA